MSDGPTYQSPKPVASTKLQMRERIEDNKDGTGQQSRDDMYRLAKFAGDRNMPPHGSSVLPAPPNRALDDNPEFSASNVQGQLPFTPECAFELEVFQQWKSGHPAYQRPSAPSEIPGVAAWNWSNPHAAGGSISMTDSGVDFSEPAHHRDPKYECPSSSVTMEVCNNPDQCELSPDMAEALQRLSVPHVCEYEQAKRLLVEKIVNKVLQKAAPRIMALLEEELQKREAEMNMEEYDEDMDSELEAKL